MSVSYDVFVGAFLNKITEYEFIKMEYEDKQRVVDMYFHNACAEFQHICKYDLTAYNDTSRVLNIDFEPGDKDEIVNIISQGMVVQWFSAYFNKQDNLENLLNTRDFTAYSPAELTYRITNAYEKAQKKYTQMMRDYSYFHGDLTVLHA